MTPRRNTPPAHHEVDAAFVPRRSPGIEWAELDGQAVLYDGSANAMHVLNATATLVWACLDDRTSVGELAADLSEAFQADGATVREDVMATVRRFAADGLLAGFESPDEARAGDDTPASGPDAPTPASEPGAPTPRVLAPPPDG
jgi:hypothetical protein